MEKKDNHLSKHEILIATILMFFGLFIILFFSLTTYFNDWSFDRNATSFGQYGDFIGGFVGTVFSLVAMSAYKS